MKIISLGSMCHTMNLVRPYKQLSYPFDSVNCLSLQNTVNILEKLQDGTLDVTKFMSLYDSVDKSGGDTINSNNKYSIDWQPSKLSRGIINKYGFYIGHHVNEQGKECIKHVQQDDNVTTYTRRFKRLKDMLNGDEVCLLVYYNREKEVFKRHSVLLNKISDLYKTKHLFVYLDNFNSADNSEHQYNKTFYLDSVSNEHLFKARPSSEHGNLWNELTGVADYIKEVYEKYNTVS